MRLGEQRSILASLEDRDRQLVRALKDGQQVVLWFEHDLYDQLQLVDALALAAPETPHTPELVVVGSFPGKPAFRGLGELTADELETLWPAGCPPARTRWPRRSRSGLPCVTPTRPRWPRPPGRTTPGCRSWGPHCSGCSRSCPPRATACPAPNGWRCRPSRRVRPRRRRPSWPSRTWRPRRSSATPGSSASLAGLGAGPARLVETQAGDPLPPPPPLGDPRAFARLPLRLTDAGQRVLDGRDDRVALLGLDRWVGGTHLTQAAAWRWDPAARVLVRPA